LWSSCIIAVKRSAGRRARDFDQAVGVGGVAYDEHLHVVSGLPLIARLGLEDAAVRSSSRLAPSPSTGPGADQSAMFVPSKASFGSSEMSMPAAAEAVVGPWRLLPP
jgi:hypothetical protein